MPSLFALLTAVFFAALIVAVAVVVLIIAAIRMDVREADSAAQQSTDRRSE